MHLLTNAIRRKLPPLYANEGKGTDALAVVKFFTPDSYFRLSELQTVRGTLGLPVERDKYFEPTPLHELIDKHEQGHY
jgi:hypothetical protein